MVQFWAPSDFSHDFSFSRPPIRNDADEGGPQRAPEELQIHDKSENESPTGNGPEELHNEHERRNMARHTRRRQALKRRKRPNINSGNF